MIFIVLKVSNWKETKHSQLVIELSNGNVFPKLNNPTHEVEQKKTVF
jgi:O-acetylhomoserine/O-acetylserine sulfhydrylase-like pyridoxal-dependent enzyme